MGTLASFAGDEGVRAAEVSGIGAFENATLGFYVLEKRDYERVPISEHSEVLSLLGNLSIADESPRVHLHATLGMQDMSAVGGHLFDGVVGATLELFVREEPGELRRVADAHVGLPLLDL
jgi:hypothetical protein